MKPPDLIKGAIAGLVATAPMTAVMLILHRLLPWHERYHLPPSQIVTVVEEKMDVSLDEPAHQVVTGLAHFSYGAAAGALYAIMTGRLSVPTLLKGTGFGLFVWLISYLGLLPAADILRPATEHPARHNALMIVAHIVWGAVTGLVADSLRQGIDYGRSGSRQYITVNQ